MNHIFTQMQKNKIIPVITIDDARDAVPLAEALYAGGINIAEITYRTRAAPDAISAISARCPDILPGAGTVTDVRQAKEAIACGAKFIVMPGTDLEIVKYCIEHEVVVIPGVATPTEITAAAKCGLDVLKFFPAECSGGTDFLKAMSGPFPDIKFIPTGGISAENAVSYLREKNVLAVGGSWIVKKEFIGAKKWEIITAEAEKAVFL